MSGSLYAASDLHVSFSENRALVEKMFPKSPADWLILAGDIAEITADIDWALGLLAGRFTRVIWVPGNHELWTHPWDPVQMRGVNRYNDLVKRCRSLGVVTPEDDFPLWDGPLGVVRIAPLFVLYDYSFGVEQASVEVGAERIECLDEYLLHPDPYRSIEEWCRSRVALTEERLLSCDDPDIPLILVGHWPLVKEPTRRLRYPEFSKWCGTELTAQWPYRFNVQAVVYGHLHIPGTAEYGGIRFEEVSLGYPREWTGRVRMNPVPRVIISG